MVQVDSVQFYWDISRINGLPPTIVDQTTKMWCDSQHRDWVKLYNLYHGSHSKRFRYILTRRCERIPSVLLSSPDISCVGRSSLLVCLTVWPTDLLKITLLRKAVHPCCVVSRKHWKVSRRQGKTGVSSAQTSHRTPECVHNLVTHLGNYWKKSVLLLREPWSQGFAVSVCHKRSWRTKIHRKRKTLLKGTKVEPLLWKYHKKNSYWNYRCAIHCLKISRLCIYRRNITKSSIKPNLYPVDFVVKALFLKVRSRDYSCETLKSKV